MPLRCLPPHNRVAQLSLLQRVLAETAVLRLTGEQATLVGGRLQGPGQLMPAPDGSAWVLASQEPRTAQSAGGHTLPRLGDNLGDSTSYDIDFAGRLYQAVLARSGTLYLAGGGWDVTARAEEGWRCPCERWAGIRAANRAGFAGHRREHRPARRPRRAGH